MRNTGRSALFFSSGFRPFFLAAAVWAVVDVLVWMGLFEHGGALPSRFEPLTWHIHEMLFGFVMAAIAGFLLTAVANWTGRPALHGLLLGFLAATWLLGRAACLVSALLPAWFVLLSDLALTVLLVPLIAREIVAARKWRNLAMIVPLIVLGIANLLMHLEALEVGVPAGLGWRLGIVAIMILISAVGGRIVPAFTRNWLSKRGEDGPRPPGLVDRFGMASLHVGLLMWAFLPEGKLTGALLLTGAALNMWRLARWRGIGAAGEPLLLMLHVGYAWLVAGVALLGLAAWGTDVPLTAALHCLAAGAMGTMILAVMTRAIRGHTGRQLTADWPTILVYLLISGAAVTRIMAAMDIAPSILLLFSASLWCSAFILFVACYGPMLLRPRIS